MVFRFIPLGLSGLVLIEETRHRDDRGFFAETYRASAFHGGGITDPFVQDNHARSSRGVLRGLHYQLPSGEEGKLLWIPPGFAHGYLVLSETADLTYQGDRGARRRARPGHPLGRSRHRNRLARRGANALAQGPGATGAGGGGEPVRRVSAGLGESGSANEPFVETPAGGLFFLNAVLAAPALLVLAPVVVRGLLRGIGAIEGPTALLDPVPAVAAYAGPWVAWLSVVPLWTSWHNLRMPLPSPARWALRAFVALHAGVLVWWAWAVLG